MSSKTAALALEFAEVAYQKRIWPLFRAGIMRAVREMRAAQKAPLSWQSDLHQETEILLGIARLCHRAGLLHLALREAQRAQAWADDPMGGGDQSQFQRARRLQESVRSRRTRLLSYLQRWRWRRLGMN